jgi:ABC-type Fe3+-hydroxamate transport system substrate-binding protein
MKFFKAIIIFTLLVLVLSACGKSSFKTESKEAITSVETTLAEEVKKPNKKSEEIQFYLPFGFEIKDESPNNIILKNGSKTYILFNNPQENEESDVVYNATAAQYEDLDVKKEFKQDKKLAFILIKQMDEGINELTVGIGGTKITTQVKTSSLKNEAKVMTQIVSSVENN